MLDPTTDDGDILRRCLSCGDLWAECDCTGGPVLEIECTCYEAAYGHQPGCPHYKPPPPWRPLNWHVTIRGPVVLLSHGLADDDGPVWAGEVELWRGAPGFDDHPELEHAIRSIMNPIHRDEFVRHKWTYDIPDHWAGADNFGPNHRRYLLLTASGGLINWSLILRLPVGTPQFVWKAIAYGFKATRKEKTS